MDACTGSAQTTTEIDIAECVGTSSLKNNLILWQNGSVINAWVMYTSLNGNASDSFHIYELDWYPTLLVFKMDGQITNTIAQSVQVPMFLLFDDEARTLPTGLPTALTVDWVRVCSDPNAACNPGDSTMIFDDEFNVGVVPISTSNQGEKKQGQKAQ
jgi:beta-glucanase (GH16 family)